jgi:putative transposase
VTAVAKQPVCRRHKRSAVSRSQQIKPMPTKRAIHDDELFAHFVTFSCYRRRRLLDHDQPKRILLGALNAQLARQSATCVGFVLMPDHVHAIIWFPEPGQLSLFMQEWKRQSSLRIRNWYESSKFTYLDTIPQDDPFWQSKYYSFEIYAEEKLHEKLDYMHLNPVRAGLANRAVEWPWSSARYYLENRSVGVAIGWVR